MIAIRSICSWFLFALLCAASSCWGGLACAKLDISPAYAHLDVLESGRTTKALNMYGVRVDSSFVLDWGPYMRLGAMETHRGGALYQAGVALGFWLPLHECVYVTPLIGVNYSYFRTHAPIRMLNYLLAEPMSFRQQFRTRSPFVGAELLVNLPRGWRAGASYNFNWCRSAVTITRIGIKNRKNESKGPAYAFFVEKDINACWSLTAAAGYNLALSHEKHGLRGFGGKLGLSYWFCGR